GSGGFQEAFGQNVKDNGTPFGDKKTGVWKSLFQVEHHAPDADKILKSAPSAGRGRAQKKETRYSDGIPQFPHQPKTTNLNEP
ncbi:hypothetical protein, partial [Alistipes onderdonkii]|uniref:hypothetical protein n=1 Tax=Alistipes onderdonkii TaxID=328813 RepID=UPI0032C13758